MTTKRLAATVGIAVCLSSAAHAQIPVTDVAGLVQKIIVATVTEATNVVKQYQAEKLYKMSLRISWWTSLAKYYLYRDLMPEWRIHNWFTDDVLYAKPYHWALTYGDASGDAYRSVVRPRVDPAEVISRLGPVAAEIVKADQATIDLADSAIVRGLDETGRLRFNGRAEAESIIRMQDDITEEDRDRSLTGVLDTVAASALVQAQNRRTRGQLEAAILEQLLVEQVWDRNGEAAHNNLVLTTMQGAIDGEGETPSIVGNATNVLSNWQLP